MTSNDIGPKRREVGSFINNARSSWRRIKEITGEEDLGKSLQLNSFIRRFQGITLYIFSDIMLQQLKELDLGNFALYQLLNNMDNIIAQETEELENIQKQLV